MKQFKEDIKTIKLLMNNNVVCYINLYLFISKLIYIYMLFINLSF